MIDIDRWMDREINDREERWMDGWIVETDGWMGRLIDGWIGG